MKLTDAGIFLALLPLAAAPALAQAPPAAPPPAAGEASLVLTAKLNGDAEVGHDGDPDGNAVATLRFTSALDRVCYDVAYHRLAPVIAAHIHAGAKGKNGDPVFALKVDADEYVKGCGAIPREVAQALIAAPEDYYVNVHTLELTDGAIRGQLSK
ncbi:MAG TPA: CHRD domain-containing protein [Novosphingobium sp.]|nr:CHRD domain-containing protein [Novosphingobium sp.]